MKPRIIVVCKRTSYSRFVEEERDPRAKELLRRHDPSVKSWLDSHHEHQKTIETVSTALDRVGAQTHWLYRSHASFDASDADLVVAVGGDGTLLGASHSVDGTPILGVNSAPRYSVGFFCAAHRQTFRRLLDSALEGKSRGVTLTRMKVMLNGRVRSERVLNDALCAHSSPAATSRYLLSYGKIQEEHRSSGLWIGPAAGSTAALKSAGGRVLPLASERLQLVVREPYTPSGQRFRLLKLLIEPGESLVLRSKMDSAKMWLDGPSLELPVGLGDEVEFSMSDKPLRVLGLTSRRQK